MKKVVLALVVVAALSSCKKDYTCVCTDGPDTESYPLKNMKKSDAEDACAVYNALWLGSGSGCELKK